MQILGKDPGPWRINYVVERPFGAKSRLDTELSKRNYSILIEHLSVLAKTRSYIFWPITHKFLKLQRICSVAHYNI